jgi:branched-chain amino acid transport system substrate-binding protein
MKRWGVRASGGRVALASVLVATLALAGCRFRLPGSTQPLLKIGLVAPFEGRFRARGYAVLYAVKLAVRQWNEAGGAGGYRLELVALDDGGDPAVAVGQVRELAVDRDVLGVLGHFTEETTLAAAPEYAAQELPLLALGVEGEGVTAGGWVVRLGPSNQLLGEAAARYAVEDVAAARLAVLRDRDELADAFVTAVRRLGGRVVLDVAIAGDGWVSRLTDAAPDLVFLACEVMTAAEVIPLARQAGVEAIFLGGPNLGDRPLVQVGSALTEGTVYLAAAPAGPDLAGGEAFVAAYRALAGHAPDSRATLAYEATYLLLEAIARAAEQSPRRPSRLEVWQQLSGGHVHKGLLGRLAFGGDGEPVDWPMAIYRVEAVNYPGRRLR